jgi:hypothetical protein
LQTIATNQRRQHRAETFGIESMVVHSKKPRESREPLPPWIAPGELASVSHWQHDCQLAVDYS